MTWDGAFDRGPHTGKRPDEVDDEALISIHNKLEGVPVDHEHHDVLVAVDEELRGRGKLPAPKGKPNHNAFKVPPPIPAAEAYRRARVAAAAREAPVEAQEPSQAPLAPRGGQTPLMPCGHPTADLATSQGSRRGSCRGCLRLDDLVRRLTMCSDEQERREALLDFEAAIRGYAL